MAFQLRFKIRKMKLTDIFAYADISHKEEDIFTLSKEATSYFWDYCTKNDDSCIENECALFRQLMFIDKAEELKDTDEVINDLEKKLIYVDFSDAFKQNEYYTALLLKYGFKFNFGKGEVITYQMFERSNSMARRNTISFIDSELSEKAQERLRLGVKPEMINYAKFASYNGLTMSQGYRVMKQLDDKGEDKYPFNKETVVVIEDICEDGINLYDGEGLIAPAYAEYIRDSLPKYEHHKPTSFQIRLPYIKGMLHECDFNEFFDKKKLIKLTDMFGVEHDVSKVRIILTASQFKGAVWIREAAKKANKGAMEYYWEKFKEYDHALYISGFNRPVKRRIKLNYQVLHTPKLTSKDFAEVCRMSAFLYNSLMGFGEGTSDEKAIKQQKALLKTNCISNEKSGVIADEDTTKQDIHQLTIDQRVIAAVKECGCLIGTDRAKKLCKSTAMGILRNMAAGRFVVDGENRYLSADLLSLMYKILLNNCEKHQKDQHSKSMEHAVLKAGRIYAPSKKLTKGEGYALLRNPHISRYELAKCIPYYIEKNDNKNEMSCYFGHLDGVVMINSKSKLHERLSGADFDGDIVKLITNKAYNNAVKTGNELVQIAHLSSKNVKADDIDSIIKSIKIAFDNKIGQYCNTIFSYTVQEYNENALPENESAPPVNKSNEKRIRDFIQYIGQELDAAKTGEHPNVDSMYNADTMTSDYFLKWKDSLDKYFPVTDEQKRNRIRTITLVDENIFDNKAEEGCIVMPCEKSKLPNMYQLPYHTLGMLYRLDGNEAGEVTLTRRHFVGADDPIAKIRRQRSNQQVSSQTDSEALRAIIAKHNNSIMVFGMRRRMKDIWLKSRGVNSEKIDDVLMKQYGANAGYKYAADLSCVLSELSKYSAEELREKLNGLTQISLGEERINWFFSPEDKRKELLAAVFGKNLFTDSQVRLLSNFDNGGYALLGFLLKVSIAFISESSSSVSSKKEYYVDVVDKCASKGYSEFHEELRSAAEKDIVKAFGTVGEKAAETYIDISDGADPSEVFLWNVLDKAITEYIIAHYDDLNSDYQRKEMTK